ncbi:uncharacterized protein LOC131157574 [Malania oleifera]|uniref:uncharacterized protein LOC131157574 n=1 Tax=Malania oleifera TaxID=397392 RepID=UPI0025AEA6A8|nr:uncharacterized protein LOC131157574 [Malania oleifera]
MYGEDSDLFNNDLVYSTFSYHKLPQQLLKLRILKLDGSFFDVHVSRDATISQLKQAVEEVFSSSPEEGQGRISWSHVWGHFCLCYEDQKLLNDKACIRNIGIKDGDQLQFKRHMSIDYEPFRKETKSQRDACKQYSELSSGSNSDKTREQAPPGDNGSDGEDQEDNLKHHHYDSDDDEIPMPALKLAHFLKGRLIYSRLWSDSRKSSNGRTRPSRFALHCLGGGPGMIRL